MPSGPRIRANNVMGTITNNPLTSGGTSFTSALLALLPAVISAHAVVTFDPLRQYGEPEIAIVTVHSPGATTATITRGAYGTTARTHPVNTIWIHAAVDEDATEILTSVTRPADPYMGQMIYETDTAAYKSYNGTTWVDLSAVSGGGGFPVAMIVPTGAATAPSGWLMCEGGQVLGSTYPALATELGTGAGSRFGAATAGNIKLPDLRRAFPMGKAASGTGATLGGVGGSKDAVAVTHNHTQNAHAHGQNPHTHIVDDSFEGNHAHAAIINQFVITNATGPFAIPSSDPAGQRVTFTTNTGDSGNHEHDFTVTDTTAVTSNNTAVNQTAGVTGNDANLPPWVSINYIIKAH